MSARRIASFFESTPQYRASIYQYGFGDDSEVLIALNAWRSAETIQRFADRGGKLVVMMTGSDLFPLDGQIKSETQKSIALADTIVLTHQDHQIDTFEHRNIQVIPKSVVLPSVNTPAPEAASRYRGLIVAHLRQQKNPFLYLRAIPYLKNTNLLHIEHFGDASQSYREDAERYQGINYTWKGLISREMLLCELKSADFYLNTSHLEGSANSLCEAIALGTPVIASAIPGNIGVLGKDYPGLFEADRPEELAARLDQFVESASFRQELIDIGKTLAKCLCPERESRQWIQLVEELRPSRL